MKLVQINAVYGINSTGTLIMQMQDQFKGTDIEQYVASPYFYSDIQKDRAYKIGNILDRKVHSLKSHVFGLQGWFSRKATKELIKWLDSIRPDIIHLHNLHSNYINFPMLMEYIAQSRTVTFISLHDCWFYTGGCVYYTEHKCERWKDHCGDCPALNTGNKSWIFDKTEFLLKQRKNLYSLSNNLHIVGVSRWIANEARQSILNNSREITYIYNWIDTVVFSSQTSKLREKLLSRGFRHISVSSAWTWHNSKGLNDLIELAKRDDTNTLFILIGRTSRKVSLRDNLLFVDRLTNQSDLAEYFSVADCFIHLSIQETFGKVTAEALSCGTPVIVYNSTASPELVTSKTGRIVEIGDFGSINQAMKEIFSLNREEVRNNCRNHAINFFSKEKNINQFARLYKQALSNVVNDNDEKQD